MPCSVGGTWLTQHRQQRDLGAPRCLQQFRLMLVMMGAPVLNTIGTNGALVRADASASIGSCLVCLGASSSHRIYTSGALVRQGALSSLGTCLCFWGTCLTHHQHQRSLGVRGCLDQHRLMPCTDGGTLFVKHRHQ